jgi:hypothetical protein
LGICEIAPTENNIDSSFLRVSTMITIATALSLYFVGGRCRLNFEAEFH